MVLEFMGSWDYGSRVWCQAVGAKISKTLANPYFLKPFAALISGYLNHLISVRGSGANAAADRFSLSLPARDPWPDSMLL